MKKILLASILFIGVAVYAQNEKYVAVMQKNLALTTDQVPKVKQIYLDFETQKDRYLIQDPPRPWRLNGNQARCYHHVSVQTEPDRGRRNRWHSMHAVSRNTRRPAIRLGLRS